MNHTLHFAILFRLKSPIFDCQPLSFLETNVDLTDTISKQLCELLDCNFVQAVQEITKDVPLDEDGLFQSVQTKTFRFSPDSPAEVRLRYHVFHGASVFYNGIS
jgi:hypothetical protein